MGGIAFFYLVKIVGHTLFMIKKMKLFKNMCLA